MARGAQGIEFRRTICAMLAALSLVSWTAHSQATEEFDRLIGFGMGYGYSAIYDFCGYPDLGAALREAIKKKVKQCPVSATAKNRFDAEARRWDAEFKDLIDAYMKQDVASRPKELATLKCPKDDTDDMLAKLRKYKQNEIGLNDLLPELSCAAGGPMVPTK